MSKIKDKATSQEVLEALEAQDIALLIPDMVDYARYRILDENLTNAEELVSDIFEKVVSGDRIWNKNYSFKEFLFGSLKSLVYNYNRKLRNEKDSGFAIKEFEDESYKVLTEDQFKIIENKERKDIALAKLKEHNPPPDYLEEMVFECWMDGNLKPRGIVEFLEVEKKEVYKAIKRLERKLGPVRELFISMDYD